MEYQGGTVGSPGAPLVVCTIVARNYLPSARLLARSVVAQHPDADVVVGVVDGLAARRDGPLRALSLDDIGLGGRHGREMAGIYSVRELSTAIKPWLLEHLLRTTGGPVLYLDPDIEVYAPIDGLASLAADHDIALTPHVLKPFPPGDDRTPGDTAILAAGIFNLGFIGVGRGAIGSGFLDFWKSRLRREAVDDPARMRFTDQRWVDFATCFPHTVVTDPGCNVAYWNVWGRALARVGTRVLVDGEPLRFYHYSGFDPRKPEVLSLHQHPRPRVLLSERPILADLCRGYAGRLLAEGYEEGLRVPYGWGRSSVGTELDPAARAAYRAALLTAEPGEEVPGPFDGDGGAAFASWLLQPSQSTGLSPYLQALWGQWPDLAHAFPDVPHRPRQGRRLAHWMSVAPDPRAAGARSVLGTHHGDTKASQCVPGINFFGYLHSEDGLGQVGRSLVAAASAVGLPHGAHAIRLTCSSQAHDGVTFGKDDGQPYDVDVVCANADQLDIALELLPDHIDERRRSAGVWFWETDVFPDRYNSAFNRLHEVWAPSRFIATALERCGRLPVRHLPIPVPVPSWTTSLTRRDLGLPEGFLVLYVFSWSSVAERKNPAAAVAAFTRAFAPRDGAHLVLKSLGGETNTGGIEALRRLASDRPDIHFYDGPVRAHRLKATIEHCDCYLSLHRSEGFGLTMAEAMALGRPVVATAWSGNLEFMDENTAHLVPATLVTIPEHIRHYGGAGQWAEPDIEAAACALRQVHEDPAGAAALGARARASIERTRSLAVTGRALEELAAALRPRTAVPA